MEYMLSVLLSVYTLKIHTTNSRYFSNHKTELDVCITYMNERSPLPSLSLFLCVSLSRCTMNNTFFTILLNIVLTRNKLFIKSIFPC